MKDFANMDAAKKRCKLVIQTGTHTSLEKIMLKIESEIFNHGSSPMDIEKETCLKLLQQRKTMEHLF